MAEGEATYTQADIDAAIEKATSGLKANRDEVLKELKSLKSKVGQFEGFDPEEYKALKAAQAKAEEDKAKGEGNWKALEAQLHDKYAKEINKYKDRESRLQSALEKELVDAAASRAIAEAKGSVKGLLPHVRPHIRVVEEDGKFVAKVVDQDGNPRIGDDRNPLSINGLIAEFKSDPDLARLYEGSGSSGGGAAASRGSATGASTIARGDNDGFLANLDGIASGKVTVAP